MVTKRLRVFAGPNGSGKSTIEKRLQGEISFGVYVNADDIERMLHESNVLLFDTYQLVIDEKTVRDFFQISTFSPIKRKEPELWKKISIRNNVLHTSCKIDSYLAADIAEFIRQQLLSRGVTFTYETVMSHEGKIEFLKQARKEGYRVYLYYIATEDPEINISRVNVRVEQHGHNVDPQVIRNRYYKSLKLLKAAIKESNRAYLWDNSGEIAQLFAEIEEGENVEIFDRGSVPAWFVKNVIEGQKF